jgi:hypothetical protein
MTKKRNGLSLLNGGGVSGNVDLVAAAKELNDFVETLVKAGFSRDEAFKMLLVVMKNDPNY